MQIMNFLLKPNLCITWEFHVVSIPSYCSCVYIKECKMLGVYIKLAYNFVKMIDLKIVQRVYSMTQ